MAALLSQKGDNNDKPRKIYDLLRRTVQTCKTTEWQAVK